LCAFCDVPFTIHPSVKLDEMFVQLLGSTRPSPTLESPGHRTADAPVVFAQYCKQHMIDSRVLPAARAGGWPERINYVALQDRIAEPEFLYPERCSTNSIESPSLPTMIHSLGTRSLSSKSSFSALSYCESNIPASYGERGYQMLDTAVRFMFPDTLNLAHFAPLTYDIILREVLIPEATIRLIEQDLEIPLKSAIDVLQQSYKLGLVQHPADDNCPYHLAAMISISNSHRNTRWSL
ncbi:hypothetical protein B0H17DRAFT_969924, partial [Mycena rosella]